MNEHNYSYTDDNLDLGQAHSYNLLLQVEANSFNYIITHQKQLMAWAENCSILELTDPQYLKDILTANYNEIIIGLSSTGFTLLPQGLFDEDHVDSIARLLNVTDTDKVYSQQQFDKSNAIVYKVDQALHNAIAGVNTGNINHKAKGWIAAIAHTNPNNGQLYLNIADEKVQFLYFADGELRFYNIFGFKNHEELAYFTAFVTTELGLKPQDLTLIISGDVNRTDKYLTYLSDFFSSVRLNEIQILNFPAKLEPHKLLALAALSLCASSEEN
jgi:hypothetical protein